MIEGLRDSMKEPEQPRYTGRIDVVSGEFRVTIYKGSFTCHWRHFTLSRFGKWQAERWMNKQIKLMEKYCNENN